MEKKVFRTRIRYKTKIRRVRSNEPKRLSITCNKKSKVELKEGDVFVLSPRENIYFYGKVLRANINNKEKDIFVMKKM